MPAERSPAAVPVQRHMRHPSGLPARVARCVLLGIALCANAASAREAEVILRGGTVYTVDPAQPQAQAVALAGGRILAVGDDEAVARHAGSATRIVELDGAMVLPGLHDSHVHPMSAGLWFMRCRLNDARDAAALARAASACDAADADGKLLVARGWNEGMFAVGERAGELDGIAFRGPAVLISAPGDRHWLNKRAFALVGLADTDDKAVLEGIERDRRGMPTGFVHGAAAAQVRAKLPQPTEAEYRAALRKVSALMNARGVTALTDASVSEPMLAAYRAAERAGELTVRVTLARHLVAGDAAALARLLGHGRRVDPMLRDNVVKLFVDGDVPERGAALLEPYADAPDSRGELHFAPAELDRVVAALDAAGFDLHLHAVGDRAVRSALDAIERAIAANGARERRHQIAHLWLVDPADMARFGRLGVIANLQLGWAKPDPDSGLNPLRLGPERARRTLAFADLAANGAMLAAGSDGPFPGFDPFAEIETGATRRAPDGRGGALQPAQALPVGVLLQAVTRNGAYAARAEAYSGTIVAGHAADLVVVDRKLLEIPPGEIGETRVLLTLLGGRAVHVAPGFGWPRQQ